MLITNSSPNTTNIKFKYNTIMSALPEDVGRKFIKLVKSQPMLYDRQNANYKRVDLKKTIWLSIARKLEFAGKYYTVFVH